MTNTIDKGKKIALNTFLLYLRMIFVMGVSLYTSRVNIQALGLIDYGLFNIVAGIIGLVTFLNSALGTSSSRFISIAIGKNDVQASRLLFDTIYKVHILLGIIVVVVAEMIGIYMVNNVLNIPIQRLTACNIIYQCSIAVMLINLVNIPMTALIIAHEKFNVFAYIGVYEVLVKLMSSYALFVWPYDKLELWGVLNMLVSLSLWAFYYFYCRSHFDEFAISKKFDKVKARQVSSFSFWNILGSLSIAFKSAGVNIILNIFFGPLVNAANAIAYQVNNAITNFSANFTTAINPQIFKTYAQGEYRETEKLVHWGGKLSFFLVAVLGMPLVVEIDYILSIWLNEYPPYAPIFCQLIIVTSWIESFNYSIGTAIQASGKIKKYQIFVSGLSLMNLPLTYVFLYFGASPYVALEISIIISLLTLILRIYFIKILLDFNRLYYIKNVLLPSIVMILVTFPVCMWIKSYIENNILNLAAIICISTLCISSIFYIFMGKKYRNKLNLFVLRKIGIR